MQSNSRHLSPITFIASGGNIPKNAGIFGFIIPVFALANAGVTLSGLNIFEALFSEISLGIILGLFVGKQIGIFGFSFLAVKLKLASLPQGVNWKNLYGAGMLAGIGFTMSLFIAGLAFTNPELLDLSKIGVLTGSIISGVFGFVFLKISSKTT